MMDTELLRMRILDLAVQGKLVLNDENEVAPIISPIEGDEILDEDKQFDIPQNWRWSKIGWIMDIDRGGSPRPIKAFLTTAEDGVNWIKIGDVEKNGKYIYKTKEKIKLEGVQKSRRVYPGDFLLTNSMSYGRPYISKIEGCVHDGWLILRNSKNMFFYDFLYYFLSSRYAYRQFSKKASGATVDNLNIDKVAAAVVPVPPIKEQVRIVEQIEKIFAHIKKIDDAQHSYKINLRVLKSKLIDAGIQGKLTEQLPEDGTAEDLYAKIQAEKAKLIKEGKIKKEKDLPEIAEDKIPFDIPSNWKWVRLGEISWFQGGYAFKSNLYVENSDNQVIRLGNVKQNVLLLDARPVFISDELANEVEEFRIKENDILITMTGTRRKKDYFYAKCVEQSDLQGKKLYLNQRVGCIKVVEGVCPQFLVKALQNTEIRKIIFERETGAVNQGNLGSEDIRNFVYIPLPPYAEQVRIANKINELIDIMDLAF